MKKNLLWLIFVFLIPVRLLSFELNDKPWKTSDFQKFFIGNLLINGDFSLPADAPILDPQKDGYVQIRKCWSIPYEDYTKVRSLNVDPKQAGIFLGGNSNVEIVGRTLSYKDTDGLLRDLVISVRGSFLKPNVVAKILFCKEECSATLVPLAEHGGELRGIFSQKVSGALVSSFTLIVKGGVDYISAVSIGEAGGKVTERHERDKIASEICQKPPGDSFGGAVYDLPVLIFLTCVGLFVLMFFVRRQEWFFSVLITAWLCFSFFGIWGLYFGVSEYRLSQGVVDRDRILLLGILSITSLMLISIGWLCSQKTFSFLKVPKTKEVLGFRFAGVVYLVLAGAVCILALSNLHSFLTLLFQCKGTHCATALAQVRQEITDLGFVKPHYQRLFFYHLSTFLSYLLIWHLLNKVNLRKTVVLMAVVSVQIFLISYNGEKGPLLWYSFGLLFIALSTGPAVVRRWALSLLSFISVAPVVLAAVGNSFADRLSFGSLTVGYKLLDVFPGKMPFLGGISLFDPLHIFGGNKFDLPFYLWRVIHPELVFSSIQGTSVTAFWGEAYANFGWLGFFVASFVLGLFIGSLVSCVRSFGSVGDGAAFTAWIVFRYAVFAESLFLTLIVDFYLVGLVCILSLLFFGKRAIKAMLQG